MKTTLERAARALCERDGHPSNAKRAGKALWRDYIPDARAVLNAIRDPSLDLVTIGGRVEDIGGIPIGALRAEAVWTSMVDTALAKQP